MIRALLSRVIGGLVLLLSLTLLTYAVFALIPLDPVGFLVPKGTGEDQKAALREQFGLDQPFLEQWGSFVWELGTEASLGTTLSVQDPVPVESVLGATLPATASLVLGGFLLTLLLALPLGMLCAVRRRTLLDRGILFFTVVGIVLHPFVVGLLLMEVFVERLDVAPDGLYCSLTGETELLGRLPTFSREIGVVGTCGGFRDWVSHMWLPWITFALFFLPVYIRIVRARTLDSLGELYVTTARAKGASERRIVTRHVAPNALGPIAAMLAVDVGTIVVAAIYIETVFGLGGIGELVVRNLSGAQVYDRNVLVGVVVVVALVITVGNLLSDVVVRGLDPRLRTGGERS